MTKTILITGATDGIGLTSAKTLAAQGHTILLHGRSTEKLTAAAKDIAATTQSYCADLSRIADIHAMVGEIRKDHTHLDVLINNAGVLKTKETRTADGLDVRFMVNTFAPYVLTQALLPIIPKDGRIVNLSSAAQAPVDLDAMQGRKPLGDMEAYAQSKLAITIWTREMAKELPDGPMVVAVNPGSLLASKMVKDGFGVAGNDLQIGADILQEAAVGASFADANGLYFDNDSGRFAQPNGAALNVAHSAGVMLGIHEIVSSLA
ncbi:MAG: SDR family NAD(P)-dependent oxidoreductase [Paracoccaceae bacterium]